MTARDLTVDQLWELRGGVLLNAKRLAEDAEILLSARRWPAAYESAYFALEEIGKAAIILLTASYVAEDTHRVNWPGFWKAFRDHSAKSAGFVTMVKLYARLFENSSEEIDQQVESRFAAELRRRREDALYVSWDGRLRTPGDLIEESQAREIVAQAWKMIEAELASTDIHRATVDSRRRA